MTITILSLGAGVQSSTLALLAATGVLPKPNCAIFADTQSEPHAVYRHLAWLKSVLPFPVHSVSAGSLRSEILAAARGEQRMDARPPFFLSSGGMLNRQCTQDYKIRPIQKKVREVVGLEPGQRGPRKILVEQWIGISTDEAARMKPSRTHWIKHRWPLIDLEMSRADCLKWLHRHDFPTPPKSACTFCPYHDNALWREMRDNDPASFADAVDIDRAIRDGVKDREGRKPLSPAKWYVHRDLKPLDQVDLRTAEQAGQSRLFDDECEGMCGI